MITNQPGLCLTIRVSDCVSILLYDPTRKAIGAVHAGRRSALARITKKIVHSMSSHFHTRPENIIVGLGSSICPCCYEIDPWKKNVSQLVDIGVPIGNIENPQICTKYNIDNYFSYRGSGGTHDMLVAGIMLGR